MDRQTDGQTDRHVNTMVELVTRKPPKNQTKISVFFCETVCLFAVSFKTAHTKRQADRWLAKTLLTCTVQITFLFIDFRVLDFAFKCISFSTCVLDVIVTFVSLVSAFYAPYMAHYRSIK